MKRDAADLFVPLSRAFRTSINTLDERPPN